MTTVDYLVNLVLSVILIIGAYQFYFFTVGRNEALEHSASTTGRGSRAR